ncbi:MAG: energy-coupling factor transporter transmembrane protein EcfT [Anaerolineales bacterium]|nr:energy-coupling factor transporter transmembrane protein EcfT [Anaerolineales bacterium]
MHAWAWIAWLVATVAAVTASRNPFYLAVILACIIIVRLRMKQRSKVQTFEVNTFRLAVFITFFSTLYNAAVSHFGDHVLVMLPAKIPLIGGNITLEALVYGFLNGLALSALFASFGLLTQVVSVRDLINIVPRAFYPIALVVSIAITFIPVTLRQYRQIQDAQAIRGHKMSGLRDWLGLLLPLLVGGLERAMQLAEAMTARGFAHTNGEHSNRLRAGLIVSLLGILGGWLFWATGKAAVLGMVLFAIGSIAIVIILGYLGRGTKRTTYGNSSWSLVDTIMVMGALIVSGVVIFGLPGLAGESLGYSPYPQLAFPKFSPWIGLSLLGLLAPLVYPIRADSYAGVDS